MTVVIHWIDHYARIANISVLYLLVVLGVAVLHGTGPAVLASVLAFLAFDWFFVEPKWRWTVHDPAEWVALLTFLAVGLITGQLAGRMRAREAEARRRAEETAALERMSWTIASHLEEQAILDEVVRRVGDVAPMGTVAVLRRDDEGNWAIAAQHGLTSSLPDFAVGPAAVLARTCYVNGAAVGWERSPGTETSEAVLPLTAQGRVAGVLYLLPRRCLTSRERQLIESLANHAAVALARERLAQEAARARALEEADRLKDALLSMVSHDLRSPLASIKASVTGLLQGEAEWDPVVHHELLMGIDQETNRLSRLVQDLLDMSRLEAGAWRSEREPCAAADLVGIALASLTPQEDARVVVNLPPELPTVSVDPTQMGRVVWNLLDNALKYSEGAIEVFTTPCEGILRLSVTDCGPGLAPGEERRVFDKFYRGPRFRESNVPGSGLGLSVCRAIVEAHGGRLLVRNRPEGGAEFTIELPYDANPGH